jgi:uncharacterized protein (TIGR00369 family)
MTKKPNKLHQLVTRLDRLPAAFKYMAITWFFGRKVKFVRTAGIQIVDFTDQSLTCELSNKKKVQNHIKGVHAAAMALLAESATGLVTGLFLPDDKLPLLKSMQIDYVRRAKGSLKAVAKLDQSQIDLMHSQEKGDIVVNVEITDEDNAIPIVCQITWAWVPKQRKTIS